MRREIYMGLIVLVALLFIASCVPVAQYYVCADGRKVNDPSMCTPATGGETQEEEEPGVQPEQPEEPKPVIKIFSEEAQALLSKSSKVSSLQYGYVESPNVLPENIYYVTRDKMRIVLKTKVKFTEKDSYDTVYLGLVQRSAVAYCEDKDYQMCPDKDREFTVKFDDYFEETPFDWLDKLTKADLTGKSKTFASRNAIEVSFEIGGEPGTMFVDSFFSMPLQISFKGKSYEFRDIVMNEVDSEDIEHQFNQ